jgi:guanylate kinase
VKDINYPARFVFLTAPTMEELERRLRLNNTFSEEKVQARMQGAKDDIKHSEIEGFYKKVIINDDLTSAVDELEQFLFGKTIEDGLPVASRVEMVANTEVIQEMDGVTVEAESTTAPDVVDVPMT